MSLFALGCALGGFVWWCVSKLFLSKKSFSGTRVRSPSIGLTRSMVEGVFTSSLKVNHYIITSFAECESKPDPILLEEILDAKLLPHLRFRAVPMVKDSWYASVQWHPVPTKAHNHVHYHVVGDEAEQKTFMQTIISNDLVDRSIPWWEVHVVTNRVTTQALLAMRVEHALGDGISFLQICGELFTNQKGVPAHELLTSFVPRDAQQRGAHPLLTLLQRPLVTLKTFVAVMKSLHIRDPSTLFRDQSHYKTFGARKVILFPPVKLQFIKDLKNRAGSGTTVNDVLFSALSGAVRRACTPNMCTDIHALVPCAFPLPPPNPEDYYTSLLRTYWCLVSNRMHISVASALERLKRTRTASALMKSSGNALVSFQLTKLVSILAPRFLRQKLATDTMMGHSLVFSNVPGPQESLYFANVRIKALYPCYANVVPQICILSYGGVICMTLTISDTSFKTENIQQIPQYFIEELKDLSSELNMTTQDSRMFD